MLSSRLLDPDTVCLRGIFERGRSVIEREAIYLDEQRWDEWLALYADDVRYWAPTWRGDGKLTCDPELELSHIFYDNRAALEDRIKRVRSKDSPASNPVPRTTHMLCGFALLEGSGVGEVLIRCNWVTHIYYIQSRTTHALFGNLVYRLVEADGALRIREKTIIINNDYIPTLIDVYFL